jgi:hypothetical protein
MAERIACGSPLRVGLLSERRCQEIVAWIREGELWLGM